MSADVIFTDAELDELDQPPLTLPERRVAIQVELRRREAFRRVNRRSLNYRPLRSAIINYLLLRDGAHCSYCGAMFEIDVWNMVDGCCAEHDAGLDEVIALDHIQPISKGGDAWCVDNLQVLHLGCNIRKGDAW